MHFKFDFCYSQELPFGFVFDYFLTFNYYNITLHNKGVSNVLLRALALHYINNKYYVHFIFYIGPDSGGLSDSHRTKPLMVHS